VPGVGKIRASLVDAANACCFVNAADLGLTGTEMPDAIEQDAVLMEKLGKIRLAASVMMGIAPNLEEAAKKKAVPFIGFVSGPQDSPSLSGDPTRASDVDLTGRMLSNGQPHRALPLTCSLCMAVAARIEGSLVQQAARANADASAPIRIAMPSGILTVASSVKKVNGVWHAEQGAFYRTQRRLFDGYVYVRASRVPGLLAKNGGKLKAA
jgi:2-methylaconitate cis-trans-isomerase PrpF